MPQLITQFKGNLVNLTGEDINTQIDGGKDKQPVTIEVKGADQEVLKELLENPKKYGNFSNIIGSREIAKTATKKA